MFSSDIYTIQNIQANNTPNSAASNKKTDNKILILKEMIINKFMNLSIYAKVIALMVIVVVVANIYNRALLKPELVNEMQIQETAAAQKDQSHKQDPAAHQVDLNTYDQDQGIPEISLRGSETEKSNDNPVPTTKTDTKPTSSAESKSNLDSDRRQLLTIIGPENIIVDILSDKTIFKFNSVPYTQGSEIKDGFTLQKITISHPQNALLEDFMINAIIGKNNQEIYTFSKRLGEFYVFEYYEGGIQITEKSTGAKTGIVLSGEKLSSVLTLSDYQVKNGKNIFMFSLIGGDKATVIVPENRIL